MSANNWTTCPRCARLLAEEVAATRAKAQELYGKVPVEEFDRARQEAEKVASEPLKRTWREYYEFYGANEGVVHASYGGSCSVCGLSVSFDDEHPIEADAS